MGSPVIITPDPQPSGGVTITPDEPTTSPADTARLHQLYDARPLWRKVMGLDPADASMTDADRLILSKQKQAAQAQVAQQLKGGAEGLKQGAIAGAKIAPFMALPGAGAAVGELAGGGVAGTAASAATQATGAGLLTKAEGGSNTEAALAAGVAGALPAAAGALKALPSTERAGQAFQKVMGAAKDVPVDITKPGDLALQIQEFAGRGGTMPKVVRDFLKRSTDPAQGPITYQELRDFNSNASRLSADEMGRLTPKLRFMVGQFSRALNDANAQAAQSVGMGEQYTGAMSEYARAMRLQGIKEDSIKAVLDAVKKGLPYGIGVGAVYGVEKMTK